MTEAVPEATSLVTPEKAKVPIMAGPVAPADPTPEHHALKEMYMTNSLGLKRLPIPALEDTVVRYLASAEPFASSPEEFAAHEQLVREFADGVGKELQGKVMVPILKSALDSRNIAESSTAAFANSNEI